MRARLVRIGNSRGIRIPKLLIEELGLTDEVELRVHEGAILILALDDPRSGWSEAAKALTDRGEVGLLDPATPTRFDDEEWEW